MVTSSGVRLRDGLIAVGITAAVITSLVAWRATAQCRQQQDNESSQPAAEANLGEVLLSPRMAKAAGIEIAPVQSRHFERTIPCNGNVGFNQNKYVKVPPKTGGILRDVKVDVGASVRAGDVLAVTDSQALGDLKALYIHALIHGEHLRWQIASYKAVTDGIAAKNLLEAEHSLEEELAETVRIESRLTTLGLSQEQIEAIDEKKDLGTTLSVIAPRAGTIVERHAVEGQSVQVTAPLFAIADLESMWVHLFIYESHLRFVYAGQSIMFYPDGLPGRAFKGFVTWISPEIDAQTRTIEVRGEVRNPNEELRANMFGHGELLIEHPQMLVVVPQTAVQLHNGKHVVFVQKRDYLFEVRQIAVGLKDDNFWEVSAGLSPGEMVATTGSFLLKSNLENPEFGKVE